MCDEQPNAACHHGFSYYMHRVVVGPTSLTNMDGKSTQIRAVFLVIRGCLRDPYWTRLTSRNDCITGAKRCYDVHHSKWTSSDAIRLPLIQLLMQHLFVENQPRLGALDSSKSYQALLHAAG